MSSLRPAPPSDDSQFAADAGVSWFGAEDETQAAPWRESIQDVARDQAQATDAAAPSFLRTYRAFLGARALLAIVLVILLAGNWLLGKRTAPWVMITVGYAALTLLLWVWPSHRAMRESGPDRISRRQAAASIGLDLVFFSLLQYLTVNTVNAPALLVLPVLMGGVLLRRLLALAVAAIATLNLLAGAWFQAETLSEFTGMLTQAGLTGFGLFAIAALSNELASRLAREERTARGSLELARQQAQLNRLVIDEMSEGVLVLDRSGRVRTANPAARRLLAAQGQTPPPPFQLRGVPAWSPLVKAIEQALSSPVRAEAGQEVQLEFDDRSQRDLRLRTRFTRGRDDRPLEDMCVVWLEDLRIVRARQRQDKLAAMGRMSAGIAHEIRNPLAAIAQANDLLAEDAATPTQQRLTQMVHDNVERLKHIVDDILAVAPGARPAAPAIDIVATVVSLCNDWRSTQGVAGGDQGLLHVDTQGCRRYPAYPHIRVRFEPEHLQRVLINLLDNAFRHNSGEPGAIEVRLQWLPSQIGPGLMMLSVLSDGEPISVDTERALFEPFFSTRSRGTGLGLYICRELCERHSANIDYRQHPAPVRHRNEFFVTMPVEPDGAAPSPA